jgi:hypothetical protein
MVSHPGGPPPSQPRYYRVRLASLHLLHAFVGVDIYRHIATTGAAFGMLLVCVTGSTPSLHSSKEQVDDVTLESKFASVCFDVSDVSEVCCKCFI